MAPNKFATMINRETNRITLVLVYAVLEWTLITFLLLNSLFSYLIFKFANYFGLKPPCLLCSRLDHIFEPPNSKSSYRDLICEHHGIELSRSGYCFNHRKLVESQDMCEDCWSSHHGDHQRPTSVLAFRWLKEIGIVKSDGDCELVQNCEVNLRCSCCGVDIKNEMLAPRAVIKPSSAVLKDTQKAIRDELVDDVDFDGGSEDPQKANIDEFLHVVNFLGEQDENRTDSLGKEGKDEEGIERSRDIQMGPYSGLIREDDNLEGFSFRLSKEGYSLVEADEDEKDVLEDPQRANIDDLLHVVNFLGEPDQNRTDSFGREGKDEEGIERSIDIQMGPYSNLKREDDNLEGLSFRLSKEGYSLVEADEDEKDVLLEDPQKANIDELLHVVHFLEELDQNGTDSLGKEGKDEDGIERRRDIQMGPYSGLVREDDNIEGYSFHLTKEGYSLVEADEDEKDVVLEAETEPLLKSSSASMSYLYADEKIIPQHLEFYIDLDHYQLIPVDFADIETEKSKGERRDDGEEDLKNRDQVKFNELWRETDDGLVLEPDIMFAPSALDAVEKLNSSSLEFLELYETNIEELSSKQGQEQEMMRDINIGVESDEAKIEGLPSEKDQEEEEIKREVGAAVVIDKHKVEILPSIKGQVEVTTKEINFHVAGDEKCDVLLTSSGDQVTEEREVTELNANIPTSDFEDVCHKEIDEIDIVSSVESIDKSEEAEPLRPCKDECPSTNDVICEDSTSTNGLLEKGDYVPMQTEERQIHKDMTVEITELELQSDVALSHEPNEVDGDIIPETLTPADSLHHLHKEISLLHRMGSADAETLDGSTANELNSGEEVVTVEELKVLLESERKTLRALSTEVDEERSAAAIATNETMAMINRLQRMGSADAETLDGSTANELNSGEEVATVEELKALLESERKMLSALYTELDEERSAAAIATNETMAMINRLQEEKATIEMEALQYQRMMEEQCEYDQEALQLMNEMLVKREKQLQELEKELEVCRKKLMDYEERERMRLLIHRKDRSCTRSRASCASCSNGEESDGLSVDLNNESREEDNSCKLEENGHRHNTPIDAILDLQDPLSSSEEERISILEQLKVLEEKLCTLAEEEEHHIGNMKPFELFYEENAKEFDRSFKLNGDANGLENGSSAINGKHHQEKWINGSMPKQLLLLFDAAEIDSDDDLSNGIEDGSDLLAIHKPPPTKFELEKKRLTIEEEVDHLYERIHALEADREFVKHCVGSLRKGDRGVHLLQEILEHLRDLKHIELQARNVRVN